MNCRIFRAVWAMATCLAVSMTTVLSAPTNTVSTPPKPAAPVAETAPSGLSLAIPHSDASVTERQTIVPSQEPPSTIYSNESTSSQPQTAETPAEPAPAPATSATSSSEAHEEKDRTAMSDSERTIRFFGSLHPVLLHFPISLLIMAAVSEFMLAFTGRKFFAPVSLFCVRFGAVFAVFVAMTGWAAASGDADASGATAWILTWHRWLGVGTAIAAVIIGLFSLTVDDHSERGAFRWLLYAIAAAVAVTGHFGGMLVYGTDYFKW